MLVDGEQMILEVGKSLLKAFGYEGIFAKSGKRAIGIVLTFGSEIDMVLLDMIMPKMDGSQTFGSLREIQLALPIILSNG